VLGKGQLAGSVATLTTTLAAGNYFIVARYEGDANYGSSSSDLLSHQVTARPDGPPPPKGPSLENPRPNPPPAAGRPAEPQPSEPPRPRRREPIPPLTQAEEDRVEQLIQQLKSKKPAERIEAAKLLGKMGQRAQKALRPLCSAILLPDAKSSKAAAEAVERIDPQLGDIAIALFADPNTVDVLQRAGRLQGDGEPLTPIILKLAWGLYDKPAATVPDLLALRAAVEALTEITLEDEGVARLVKRLLGHEASAIREVAVRRLGRLRHARIAWPELVGMARKEPLENIRIEAIHVLGKVADEKTAPQIEKTLSNVRLSDPSAAVREAAQQALERVRTVMERVKK
jgi:HEAT repeat protein